MPFGDDVLGATPLGDLEGFTLPVQVTGQRQVDAFIVPRGATKIRTGLGRAAFGVLTHPVSWSMEVSYDNGDTWIFCGGATTLPGDFLDEIGQISPESWIEVALPLPSDGTTKMRCTVNTAEAVTTDIRVSAK